MQLVNFFCIGDEDTVRGFRLAGVPGQVASTREESALAVEKAAANQNCAIIILTEEVAAGIPQLVESLRLERTFPLIVEIGAPGGPVSGRQNLAQLVQAAIGIRIDLDERS